MRCDLSRTEREIMQVLWDNGGQMSPRDILEIFNGRGREWKRQTLNTLLLRMEEKEVIVKRRSSVQVRCSEFEYRHLQSEELVREFFNGSLNQFVAAFTGNSNISREDAMELDRLIDSLKRKGDRG